MTKWLLTTASILSVSAYAYAVSSQHKDLEDPRLTESRDTTQSNVVHSISLTGDALSLQEQNPDQKVVFLARNQVLSLSNKDLTDKAENISPSGRNSSGLNKNNLKKAKIKVKAKRYSTRLTPAILRKIHKLPSLSQVSVFNLQLPFASWSFFSASLPRIDHRFEINPKQQKKQGTFQEYQGNLGAHISHHDLFLLGRNSYFLENNLSTSEIPIQQLEDGRYILRLEAGSYRFNNFYLGPNQPIVWPQPNDNQYNPEVDFNYPVFPQYEEDRNLGGMNLRFGGIREELRQHFQMAIARQRALGIEPVRFIPPNIQAAPEQPQQEFLPPILQQARDNGNMINELIGDLDRDPFEGEENILGLIFPQDENQDENQNLFRPEVMREVVNDFLAGIEEGNIPEMLLRGQDNEEIDPEERAEIIENLRNVARDFVLREEANAQADELRGLPRVRPIQRENNRLEDN